MNIGVGAGVDVEALLQENARLKQEKSVLKKVTPHTYVDRWGECPRASLREPCLACAPMLLPLHHQLHPPQEVKRLLRLQPR